MAETWTPVTLTNDTGQKLNATYFNRVETGIDQIDVRVAALETVTSISPTLVNAKGDLIAATANDTVTRVAVGSNGQVLTANSAASTGLTWTTPSGGSGSSRVIDVTQSPYSAVGNGVANDTSALQSAIAALTPGDTLLIPAGKTFNHTAVLDISIDGVRVTGGGTLRATVLATSAVWITGDYVTMEDINLTVASRTGRGDAFEHMKLLLKDCVGAVVRRVRITDSYAAGCMIFNSSDYLIEAMEVSGTAADGIHNTGGSHDGLIVDPICTNIGDDGVAIVSYEGETICQNIICRGARINIQTGSGRGMTVVGGNNVLYEDFFITSSWGAALLVGCEASYSSFGCDNIIMQRGVLVGSNVAATDPTEPLDHGAVLVVNDRDTPWAINNVAIRDITIRDTNTGASRILGSINGGTGTVTNIRIQDIRFEGTNPATTHYDASSGGTRFERFFRGGTLYTPAITLTDGATVNTNAALGSYFRLTMGGNRTLAPPTNSIDGQLATWEVTASGANRTLTLSTASDGFAFGTTITAISVTTSGLTDYITARYSASASRWRVVQYVKGYA